MLTRQELETLIDAIKGQQTMLELRVKLSDELTKLSAVDTTIENKFKGLSTTELIRLVQGLKDSVAETADLADLMKLELCRRQGGVKPSKFDRWARFTDDELLTINALLSCQPGPLVSEVRNALDRRRA